VSELDEDHTARVKKGRSEKIQREEEADDDSDLGSTSEVNEEDQMRVDQEDGISQDEEEEEEEEEKEDGQKQALDEELYIIADDGQKKKLVKIRLGSPEVCLSLSLSPLTYQIHSAGDINLCHVVCHSRLIQMNKMYVFFFGLHEQIDSNA
jgi:hypothetical protein